jgi:hypothetical protein
VPTNRAPARKATAVLVWPSARPWWQPTRGASKCPASSAWERPSRYACPRPGPQPQRSSKRRAVRPACPGPSQPARGSSAWFTGTVW